MTAIKIFATLAGMGSGYSQLLPFEFDDGGRALAGFKGSANDCGVRASAIATGLPYAQVYDELAERRAATGRSRSGREGLAREIVGAFLIEHGFVWVPVMKIGSGCTIHLNEDELPNYAKIVTRLSRHYSAVINGTIRDTYDPSRDGTRCVYGYWYEKG